MSCSFPLGLLSEYVKAARVTAHLSVNREMNAILKVKERSALMRMDRFSPSHDQIMRFAKVFEAYDGFKMCEMMLLADCAACMAFSMRKYVQIKA